MRTVRYITYCTYTCVVLHSWLPSTGHCCLVAFHHLISLTTNVYQLTLPMRLSTSK